MVVSLRDETLLHRSVARPVSVLRDSEVGLILVSLRADRLAGANLSDLHLIVVQISISFRHQPWDLHNLDSFV